MIQIVDQSINLVSHASKLSMIIWFQIKKMLVAHICPPELPHLQSFRLSALGRTHHLIKSKLLDFDIFANQFPSPRFFALQKLRHNKSLLDLWLQSIVNQRLSELCWLVCFLFGVATFGDEVLESVLHSSTVLLFFPAGKTLFVDHRHSGKGFGPFKSLADFGHQSAAGPGFAVNSAKQGSNGALIFFDLLHFGLIEFIDRNPLGLFPSFFVELRTVLFLLGLSHVGWLMVGVVLLAAELHMLELHEGRQKGQRHLSFPRGALQRLLVEGLLVLDVLGLACGGLVGEHSKAIMRFLVHKVRQSQNLIQIFITAWLTNKTLTEPKFCKRYKFELNTLNLSQL